MPSEKETVYLIDGTSYVYRAYHAIRNLSNSRGFATNAIFGFTKMVLKLLEDKRPQYLAIVFDSKGPTFRHQIYDEYKANRPPMPEDMAEQIPVIKQVVKCLNIRAVEKGGYEADDIIGTLAKEAEDQGFQVVMVTGDKDFKQLITPNIVMWDSMKDTVVDYMAFKKAYGIEPEQYIDVLGLAGDSSDNIPGVPGVGEKTALDLIREFGSLDSVFDHVEEITRKKLKENMRNSIDKALLSKRLVTIDRSVSLDEAVQQLKVGEPSKKELAEIFRDLEFRGLWEQFAIREEEVKDYRTCLSNEDLEEIIKLIKAKGTVSIDIETTSQDPLKAKLVGLSLACEPGRAWYVPLAHAYLGVPEQLDWPVVSAMLKGVLEDEKIAKIGQNIKYDAEVLMLHGALLKGIHFDTMIASYVINPSLRQHNLDYLAQHYLNHRMITFKDVVGKGKNAHIFADVDIQKATEYACEDADITLQLWRILEQKMRADENEKLFYDLEMNLLPVLMDMEMTGIAIDADFFQQMSRRFAEQMKELEKEIYAEAGMEFNINSSQQLGHVLFEKLQLPVQKKTTKTKSYSTDVGVLKKLSAYPHKMPKLVIRYRTLSKLKSTYLDALIKMVNPSTGRVHTSFNQTVAATGRLSSSNPNLQNIPIRGEEGREIRKGFVAGPGCYLVSADYSQIELRVFAHYSDDRAFIEAFRDGEDIHTRTASEILGLEKDDVTPEMRRIAKAINFGIIYGMGPQKLKDELGIDLKTAKDYLSSYYQRYQGVVKYREEVIESARQNGYVSTLFGRRRYLPDIQHANRIIRGEADRMAMNTPIQGTAADLIKKAMINIHNRLNRQGLRAKMLLQVHDELVFEAPQEELEMLSSLIKEEMEDVYTLSVPLKVDINTGRNWDEAH